jgi:DNA primase
MIDPKDYLLFMFSMKGIGKRVDLNHIKEKISRDLGKYSENEVKSFLNSLIKKGFLEEVKGEYGVTPKGKEFFSKRFEKIGKSLEKINKAWFIVYKAKQYYPIVANTVLEFCKDRYCGFYCLFTERRFFRRDFRGKKIVLKNLKDLMFFVNIHYIDVIPCVHRIGKAKPDWLVMDIDAGPKVSWEKTKEITEIIYKIFQKFELNPCLKFSGSRGFQIWSLIKDFPLPPDYIPLKLRGETKRKKNYFSLFADFIRVIQKEVNREVPGLTTCEVSLKEERKDKILLDPSIMKPMGLTRVPYGIHSKTGLVSLPLSLKELKKFEPLNAIPEKVIERYRKRGNEFLLKPASPKKIIEILLKS